MSLTQSRVQQLLVEANAQKYAYADIQRRFEAENAANYEEQVERITADFHTPAFDLPTGQHEAIVSAFAICHGQNEDSYRNLYHRIVSWLKPGGIFINFDHILGGSDHFTMLNAAGWAELMAPSFTEAQIEWAVKNTYQEDSPLSLWQHLQLMDEAGLTAVDVLWKKHIFAIYVGMKPL